MNAETNTEADGEEDEDDDQETPPLEFAAVAGVLVGDFDLFVALLEVLDGGLCVLLGGVDDGFLLLDEDGHLLEQLGHFGEGLFDAPQLVVAGADVAEDGVGLSQAVGLEL